jgi:hypothetical protein
VLDRLDNFLGLNITSTDKRFLEDIACAEERSVASLARLFIRAEMRRRTARPSTPKESGQHDPSAQAY